MLLQLLVMKTGIRGFANVSSIRTTWMDRSQIARPHAELLLFLESGLQKTFISHEFLMT